ncbi:MAG: FISUMP domain-containing protein, partial [Candidatus Kapaibacteriota bacterium]
MKSLFISFLVLIAFCSCKEQVIEPSKEQVLSEVQFGSQIWSGENLSRVTFRNGDTIPYISDAAEWEKAGREGKPAWCYYAGDESKAGLRGKLYNWHAVNDSRGLAPQGWHIPTVEEWRILF